MSIKGTVRAVLQGFLLYIFALNVYGGADWSQLDAGNCVHWVRSGETLSAIAQGYGLDEKELIDINKIDKNMQLFKGMALGLPASIEQCEPIFLSREKQEITRSDRPMSTPKIVTETLNRQEPKHLQEPSFRANKSPRIVSSIDGIPAEKMEEKSAAIIDNFDFNYKVKSGDFLPETVVRETNHSENKIYNDDVFSCDIDQYSSASDVYNQKINQMNETQIAPINLAFGERPYSYYGNQESVAHALKNFAASYSIPLVLGSGVSGVVNGKIGPLFPVDFLNHIANVYGLSWYFDGHGLYVYNSAAVQQTIISLNYLSTHALKRLLQRLHIWDKRFFWKEQSKEGVIIIAGPPRYVNLVTDAANKFDAKEGVRLKSKLTVCTFPLKYAWATDQSYNFREKSITVPGVASLLQKIILGGGVADISDVHEPTEPYPVLPAPRISRSIKEVPAMGLPVEGSNQQLNKGTVADKIFITADPRQNAIIVHDLASKMAMYKKLITSLDKPTAQIEISVSIIDVNTASLEALGVRYSSDHASFDPSQAQQAFPAFTTILSANISNFNARINLLANEGKARIVSRPSILTLNNLEAVLDNTSTSYVKVEANQDAQLFPVTSGTVVQVTPRIVTEEKGRKIHMSINIQDGKNANQDSQSLPTISNSSLNTQAVVYENESLLIGGFYREETEKRLTKVPLLGDLPVLGALFRTTKNLKNKGVRVFLITPRIIDLRNVPTHTRLTNIGKP